MQPGRGFSPKPNHVWHADLGLPASITIRNKFLLIISHLVYCIFVIETRMEEDETRKIPSSSQIPLVFIFFHAERLIF